LFLNVDTATTTLTVSLAAGGTFFGGAIGVEYSGAKFRPDLAALFNTAVSTSPSTNSLTTNYGNELLVAIFGRKGAQTSEQTSWLSGITNSFSSVAQTSSFSNTANDSAVAFCERIVSSAGSYSSAGTQTSAAWATVLEGFVSD